MSQATPVARDVRSLREHMIGKKVAFVQICGVNSLKTLHPAPDAVVGDQVVDVVVNEDARQMEFISDKHAIAIDLARTGTAVTLLEATRWSPSGGGPMPTARLIFDDGTGVDFREPAKTKRITFTIRPN